LEVSLPPFHNGVDDSTQQLVVLKALLQTTMALDRLGRCINLQVTVPLLSTLLFKHSQRCPLAVAVVVVDLGTITGVVVLAVVVKL
jgi:hypothetical protein